MPEIHIGKLTISTYYLAMFLGFVFMVVLMLLPARRRKYGLRPLKAILFATAVLIVSILGCKLLFIIENFRFVLDNGLSFGGFSFFGAAFLVPLLMPVVGFAFRMRCVDSLDNSAITGLSMLGTIRVGCFFNGCCGGTMCSLGSSSFQWPTQLIEAFLDFGILAWLLIIEARPDKRRGLLYPRFMISYGIVRFLIEFLRDTPKDWLGLSHGHWFSIISIVAGTLWIVLSVLKRKKVVKTRR